MADTFTTGKYTVVATHNTDKLETTLEFYKAGFLSSAKQFARHTLHALTGNCVFDEHADLFFVPTASSDSEDSQTIFCFRLSTGALLWQVHGAPGGKVTLHASKRLLDAGIPYGIPDSHPYIVRVTYDGQIIERNPASAYDLASAAETALGNGDHQQARQSAERALKTDISPNTKAKMHRILGQIAEQNKDTQAAIAHYERALALNPKIGVKRQLEKLRAG